MTFEVAEVFHKNVLELDAAREVDRLASGLLNKVRQVLRKRGGVVGVSGGVDSAVVLGLAARALGPAHVTALLLPERDSDPESERLGRLVAARYGVPVVREDISPALDGFGCYRRRDEAIRRVVPEYDSIEGYKSKI